MSANEWIVDRVVSPDGILAAARVKAVDGRIMTIDHEPAGTRAERLRGTLLPGFVDLQVNGAGGRSVDEATPDALDTVARAVFEGGAVAFLPTLITADWQTLLAQVRAVAEWIAACEPRADHATPLGLHLEGPFLTTSGAHPVQHFVDPTPERIDELLRAADGHLRLVTLASARTGAAHAVERLTAAGVTCAIGHCDRPEGFAAAVDAGATCVTHLFNVMGPLHHRDDNVATRALDEPRISCPIIVDGVHVQPAMVRHAFRILGPDRTVLVTDAVAAAGMPDGTYRLSGIEVHHERGIVRDRDGRLAGAALTMALAARNFREFVPTAGDWTLARIASHNPARLIGAEEYGRIAEGQRAAFTLLADDGSARCVMGD
ncbi:MAG: N-acetylglucosamine-6-phosphate deacetylase [bacterium]|nr:N-acetylglucosamine-6-phosphate deacetylase [bacterium]